MEEVGFFFFVLCTFSDCFQGHFERRIAFGYDADLIQVRAEYDGLMLHISIPRRVTPVPVSYPSRTYDRS